MTAVAARWQSYLHLCPIKSGASAVFQGRQMSQLGTFHHIGLACRSMADEYDQLTALGYSAEGEPILDPVQQVRVQFFAGGGPRIELVEPASDDSPVHGWLK